jgi:HK97 family phage portal protein
MGVIARLLGLERRDSFPTDPYWANFMMLRGGPGGLPSPDNVVSNLAVAHRCISLRSELLASVPLHLYRRTADGGRERATDSPLYDVLHDISNPLHSAYEARELLIRNLDYFGNSYARIERNARGQVTALWPFRQGDISVELLPTGRLRFRAFDGRRTEILLQEEILHLRGPSRDGMLGLSPITLARGALTLALGQTQTAQGMSDNALRPSAALSYPDRLSQDQKEKMRADAAALYAGPEKAGGLVVADGGAKFEKLAFSAEDSQFLEQRKLSNEDVARIFNCPPTSVGLLDRATYSNVEQESKSLVQNCLAPLAARIEAAMMRCLLTDVSRRSYYISHDLDSLLRGAQKDRFDAYRIARESGIYSANDCRRMENEPPVGPEGNILHMPANWIALGRGAGGQQNPQ